MILTVLTFSLCWHNSSSLVLVPFTPKTEYMTLKDQLNAIDFHFVTKPIL